jgi:hypothetical protein
VVDMGHINTTSRNIRNNKNSSESRTEFFHVSFASRLI